MALRDLHGYYDHYCFLPRYVLCGQQLLVAYLRRSNQDGAKHAWAILSLLVKRLRQAWPAARIVFRGDSGFCRHRMFDWCERHGVRYLVGLARNPRLEREAAVACEVARDGFEATGRKSRLFTEFEYAARNWSRPRRVIARIEHGPKGRNPRFIVTNLNGEADEPHDRAARGHGEPDQGATARPVRRPDFEHEVVGEPVPSAARGAGLPAARNDAPHGPAGGRPWPGPNAGAFACGCFASERWSPATPAPWRCGSRAPAPTRTCSGYLYNGSRPDRPELPDRPRIHTPGPARGVALRGTTPARGESPSNGPCESLRDPRRRLLPSIRDPETLRERPNDSPESRTSGFMQYPG